MPHRPDDSVPYTEQISDWEKRGFARRLIADGLEPEFAERYVETFAQASLDVWMSIAHWLSARTLNARHVGAGQHGTDGEEPVVADDRETLGEITIEVFDAGADSRPELRYVARVKVRGMQDDHPGATVEEAVAAGARWASDMLTRDQ